MPVAVRTLKPVQNPPGELENLFRAHHDRVFRTAHRITGSAADAEDVLQTVFLRLIKGRGNYDFAEHPEAYLSRAAINASLDLMRSRNRSRAVGFEEADAGAIESKVRNPEAQHADRELQILIRQAVSRLGETAGEMFVLRYYEGYDNQEIAKLLPNRSYGTEVSCSDAGSASSSIQTVRTRPAPYRTLPAFAASKRA